MKISGSAHLFLITCFIFLSLQQLNAQTPAADSLLYRKAISNAVQVYYQVTAEQSGLFNGSQYGAYPFRFEEEGHQYFMSNKPGMGAVLYDNVLYESVQLQYDEVQEVVIMQDSVRRIQLLNPRIASFTLFGNPFVRIVKDSTSRPLVRTGFYNVLYNGGIVLLKKEEKLIREEVTREAVLRFIDVNTYYYLQKAGVYYSIRNKNSLADIFDDRKKEIRQFIRKNKLSYKHDRDNMLAQTVAYYDQLNKKR